MNDHQKSLSYVHLAVFLFGFPGVIGKILAYSPLQLTWLRLILASLTLFIIIRWQKEKLFIFASRDLLWLIISGCLLAFHWSAFFWSIKLSTVAIGLLSYSTFPIFTVFLEPLLLKSAFKKVNLILAIFCFLGVFLMVPEFKITNRFFLAIIWGVLAGLSFSFLTIINRKLSQKYSSLLVAFYQQTAAAIWLFPLFLWSKISLELNLKNLLWLIALGSICTAGAHTLFIKGLKYLEAQTSSLISALEPVYGVIFGYVLLKERPDLRTLSGGLLILGAVTAISIFNIKEKKDFLLIK